MRRVAWLIFIVLLALSVGALFYRYVILEDFAILEFPDDTGEES